MSINSLHKFMFFMLRMANTVKGNIRTCKNSIPAADGFDDATASYIEEAMTPADALVRRLNDFKFSSRYG